MKRRGVRPKSENKFGPRARNLRQDDCCQHDPWGKRGEENPRRKKKYKTGERPPMGRRIIEIERVKKQLRMKSVG